MAAPRGFFAGSTLAQSKPPQSLVPKCGACGLHKTCISPKMAVTGEGRRRVLVVAEAPGEREDETGVQLVGSAGAVLRSKLHDIGIDLDRDCWKTNALICRPPNNRQPTAEEVDYCRPNLLNTITALKPDVIIPLGGVAVGSLIGHIWREDPGGIGRWAGWQIPSHAINAWVCPTWHPSYIQRLRDADDPAILWWTRHLKAAFQLQGIPWPGNPPKYEDRIERIYDTDVAARIIRGMIARGGPVAFDYETNMLKPDCPEARIVSCSVCWRGVRTIAYPWHGAAITATRELLVSPLPKVASNAKFEERWTWAAFGHGVRAWGHDTLLGAHCHDNRPDVCSIKFQSFIWLGTPTYDDHIAPFLQSLPGQKVNRIETEIALPDLLLYNGMDSLLEFLVMVKQREALGYAPL